MEAATVRERSPLNTRVYLRNGVLSWPLGVLGRKRNRDGADSRCYITVSMHRILLGLFAALALSAADVNTFSIVAYDPATGDCGVTVASKYFSVGAVVPWAEAGTGCIATQANVNVGYGPRGLELLRQGFAARQVVDKLLSGDTFPGKDGRQVAVIDQQGNVAAFTGPNAPNWAGGRQGKAWAAQGNILVGPRVPAQLGALGPVK